MAMVRELIRQEKRNLGLVCLVGGMPVDWLAAAGVIDRFIGAAVSMEQFGLCQQYRKAVEEGRIRVEELSETALNARLGAGARNLPFLPTRGLIGTDLIDHEREPDPVPGPVRRRDARRLPRARPRRRARPRPPRRRARATSSTSRRSSGPTSGSSRRPRRKVIVTVEEIVDSEVLRRNPDRTVLPGLPRRRGRRGALRRPPDVVLSRSTATTRRFHLEWAKVSRDDGQTQDFLRRYVLEPETQADYLDAVGGSARLMEVSRI